MSTLFNSIVRGFGNTIGRAGAKKLLEKKSTIVVRKSASLTFWQGIKTIFWFIPMFFLSTVLNVFWDMFTKDFLSKTYKPNFTTILIWSIIFTIIIGYGYYQKNKESLVNL